MVLELYYVVRFQLIVSVRALDLKDNFYTPEQYTVSLVAQVQNLLLMTILCS